MRRRSNSGSGTDWRPKPIRVHRGGSWARANRRKAERRQRLGRTITLAVGLPLVVVLAGALLFGERGLWRVAGMADHQRTLKRDIATIEAENAALRDDIAHLKSDPLTIESIARERLGMGRKGEIVYFFPSTGNADTP